MQVIIFIFIELTTSTCTFFRINLTEFKDLCVTFVLAERFVTHYKRIGIRLILFNNFSFYLIYSCTSWRSDDAETF